MNDTLDLHRSVASLEADVKYVKESVVELKSDVRDLRDGLAEERVKLARFAVVLMGLLYAASKVLDPVLARVLG